MIWQLDQVSEKDVKQVGGKALSLARMMRKGIRIPSGICIGTEAYDEFVSASGLRERIFMELNRKKFDEMRWEEIWDAALRIRNLFVKTPMPAHISEEFKRILSSQFGHTSVVIRSSAPGEDAAATSFAGLHESYVNIRETGSIVEHIRLVWASLWSDRALLYRRELGLRVEGSSMAIVVQELIAGERSGVVFGINPNDDSQGIIEAVHGLNQGMVDGTVEPDRWIMRREAGTIISHLPARREKVMVPCGEGVELKPLPKAISVSPPLNPHEARKVFALARKAEALFHTPQDVEWTFRGTLLYALQSRPVTAARDDASEDNRPWYMSLTRSFENLKQLREHIETELIPGMIEEAERLAELQLGDLTDGELSSEISRRLRILKRWEQIYEDKLIPFAHGARLFGQVYNDTMHPSDPYEFTDLLGGTNMASIQRNEMLAEMAKMIGRDPSLEGHVRNRDSATRDSEFGNMFDIFMEKFGEFTFSGYHSDKNREHVIDLLLEMASREAVTKRFEGREEKHLAEKFLSRFTGDKKNFAAELLDLGRASYQLRDDDNIYLGKIEGQMHAAVREGKRRISARDHLEADRFEAIDVAKALTDPSHRPRAGEKSVEGSRERSIRARQIVGQPAGAGIGTGFARIITNSSDLFEFKAGEILVCDSIDPNMTFIVPLAAGIVERRGGMLIHGAIVAREYGIPCVTGVPDATSMIHNGQQVTVDGFLGIVIIGKPILT